MTPAVAVTRAAVAGRPAADVPAGTLALSEFTDTAHGELIDVTKTPGQLVIELVRSLAMSASSVFDEERVTGVLTFDSGGCAYEGETSAPRFRPWLIELRNDTHVPVWFSLFSLAPGLTAKDVGVYELPLRRVDDPPDGVVSGGFKLIPAASTGTLRWVFTEGSMRWVTACMPDGGSDHPAAGLMHPSDEIWMLP